MRTLGLEPIGAETGSATALVQYLRNQPPEDRLLFLSGNRRRDTLPEGLEEMGRPFDEQVVYETHPRTTFDLPPSSQGTWLVFFSPSGIEAVQAADGEPDAYRIAAIGPTTAGALRTAGLRVQAVADNPSPPALVTAIRRDQRKAS